MKGNNEINELISFINDSPTAFHAVSNVKRVLSEEGFKELDSSKPWEIKNGAKYYLTRNDSALIVFVIGRRPIVETGFRIIGAHVDSPALKIKPASLIKEQGYCKINIELYGSPIISTWFDRMLSIAGKVVLNTNNPFKAEKLLVRMDKPLLIIPNLAIHLNPDINKGHEINPQKELLPIITMDVEDYNENKIKELLAKEMGVKSRQINDYELFLYPFEKGSQLGVNNEFISSARLDDLEMVFAAVKAIVNTPAEDTSRVLVLFDNEEVGSMTKQGAASPMLRNILERLVLNQGYNSEAFYRALSRSFILSADMAHAIHPNYPEKHDPTNRPVLNGGPVIKLSANQRYTSDSESVSVIKGICEKNKIPYQFFVNRSDQKGGSTIGPVSSTQLDISSVDIGSPLLAMHSIRELAGVEDHLNLVKLFDNYYRTQD